MHAGDEVCRRGVGRNRNWKLLCLFHGAGVFPGCALGISCGTLNGLKCLKNDNSSVALYIFKGGLLCLNIPGTATTERKFALWKCRENLEPSQTAVKCTE